MDDDYEVSEPATLLNEFRNRCTWIFVMGVACIFLGCTLILPIYTLRYAYQTCELSEELGVDTLPLRARLGIFLAVSFGAVESLAVLRTFYNVS